MTSIDTNVSNYTLSELMAIVEIDDLNTKDIIENTNFYIKKYNKKDPLLAVFFKKLQSELLQYAQDLEPNSDDDENDENKIIVEGYSNMSNDAKYPAGDKQVSDWYQNEVLTQSDENQSNKITNRKQKVQVFGNDQATMNREQIATTDTYNLPVKQDSLNPNLKNTISRFINLDSQFRQYTSGIDSTSTDYTLDLSDSLKNALSLSLYSYQIPYSWYTIDTAYGNSCFYIIDGSLNVAISIPPGNYNQIQFQSQLNNSFIQAGFTFPQRTSPTFPYDLPVNTPVYYNSNNGIISMFLIDGSFNDPNGVLPSFTISTGTTILFYDFTGNLQCNITCRSKNNHFYNNSLGWLMGFKLPYVLVDPSGNFASSVLDLNGPKYLILVIDDYNQNHVNNSLVSISQFSNTLKMPNYYSPDLPYTCLSPSQQGDNLQQLIDGVVSDSVFDSQTVNAQNGLLIAGKYENDYTSTQIMLPSAPRTLTNAQLYTINEINKNRNNLTNYLAKAPTSSDILAILPTKTSVGVPTGSLLVEFSGSLQDSKRTYFGPVNIERMAVKLLDDKGNVLNLNGNDWCVTLVCECLYQY
jgi:hypothetical protein